jgi:hypothetical protein
MPASGTVTVQGHTRSYPLSSVSAGTPPYDGEGAHGVLFGDAGLSQPKGECAGVQATEHVMALRG